jgi:antirestriction protein ArdC
MNYQLNKVTGVIYQGENQAILQAAQAAGGYTSDAWCTYLQAKELDLKVKKGEHGTHLRRVIEYEKKTKQGGVKTEQGLRHFVVFNEEQLEQIVEIPEMKGTMEALDKITIRV